jgi:hypothetical protein
MIILIIIWLIIFILVSLYIFKFQYKELLHQPLDYKRVKVILLSIEFLLLIIIIIKSIIDNNYFPFIVIPLSLISKLIINKFTYKRLVNFLIDIYTDTSIKIDGFRQEPMNLQDAKELAEVRAKRKIKNKDVI